MMRWLIICVTCVYLTVLYVHAKQEIKVFKVTNKDRPHAIHVKTVLSYILTFGSLIIPIGMWFHFLSGFMALYILAPLFISLDRIYFKSQYIKAWCLIAEGTYNIGTAMFSIVQYYTTSSDSGKYALGFTVALAIYAATSVIDSGIKDLKKAEKSGSLF